MLRDGGDSDWDGWLNFFVTIRRAHERLSKRSLSFTIWYLIKGLFLSKEGHRENVNVYIFTGSHFI